MLGHWECTCIDLVIVQELEALPSLGQLVRRKHYEQARPVVSQHNAPSVVWRLFGRACCPSLGLITVCIQSEVTNYEGIAFGASIDSEKSI